MTAVEEILSKTRYDPELGALVAIKQNGLWQPNKPIGQTDYKGYRVTRYKGKVYKIHRLIWISQFGPIPASMQIDHIDGDPANNKINNLRLVTSAQNQQNMKLRRDNKSGTHGVFWDKHFCKWVAHINFERKREHLGYFYRIENAILARKVAERLFGYHPNHGRTPMSMA